jgi:WhiB family redox-sensing transcriptional regulator
MTADLSWMDLALCAETDPEAFYPEPGEPAGPAKRVCMACEVRAECLDYALGHMNGWYDIAQYGVWGGKSARQRRRLLRGREPEREAA